MSFDAEAMIAVGFVGGVLIITGLLFGYVMKQARKGPGEA